jgi:hypothetical protein
MNDTARQAEITVGELDAILEEVDRLETIMRVEFERLRAIEAAARERERCLHLLAVDPARLHPSELNAANDALRASLASSPVLPDRRYVVDEYCATCDLPIMDAEQHEVFHASADSPKETEH